MPGSVEQVFAFLAGAAVGSFVNLAADRLPAGGSLLRPPSGCPGCGRRLRPWELVPILSYFLLRGRCSSCGRPIGRRVWLVELAAAVLAWLVCLRLGFNPAGGAAFALCAALLLLAVVDQETGLLPDVVTWPLLAAGLLWGLVRGAALQAGLGGLLLGGLIWLTGFGYFRITGREGMGGGDPKLAGAIGAWLLAEAGLFALTGAAALGAIHGLALTLAGRAGMRTALPFGPFLSLGATLALLWRPPETFYWN